jgi:GT2 family glycosyltransferase
MPDRPTSAPTESAGGEAAPAADARPLVSVIVPTFNRLARLQRVIEALRHQTYPPERYEVVVVSDGSTDGTDEYLRGRPPHELTFVSQPNAGPAAARNLGIRVASGSLVAFIDDDVIAAPELLERHVAHHREADDLVVIGPMLTPLETELSPWVMWEQAMLYRQYDAMLRGWWHPTPRQFYTGNASVARAAVEAVGGFDTRFRRAEDIELAYRLEAAGLRFVFDPEAVGYHHADRSFASWLQNAHDYGTVDVILARDQGRSIVRDIVNHGFQRRSVAVRSMTRACLGRPRLEALTRWLFTQGYAAGRAMHVERVTAASLSGLYNMAYYRGLADELGGAEAFGRAVAAPNGVWA